MSQKVVSKYAITFDESNILFGNRDYNRMFLRQQELYYNDMLKKRGYVFLRDIYESLEIPNTEESIVVGWIYDESKGHIGDNFIEFDITESEDGKSFTIDFNVDGDIRKHFK